MASFYISCRNGCGRGERIMALPTGTEDWLCMECGAELREAAGLRFDGPPVKVERADIEAQIEALKTQLRDLDAKRAERPLNATEKAAAAKVEADRVVAFASAESDRKARETAAAAERTARAAERRRDDAEARRVAEEAEEGRGA